MRVELLGNQKELIERWFVKSKKIDENNFIDNFIYLWISFNAFYRSINSDGRYRNDGELISEITDKYAELFSDLVNNNSQFFENFLKYINEEKENKGFIQDLRHPVEKERHKKRYNNLKSLCEYIDCVYQVRCNLFHGGKLLQDDQDEELVKLAFESLVVFLEEIYKKEGIIS